MTKLLGSTAALTLRPDGRVEYRFRKPDPTGRTSWVTDGPTWCRRIAALIPPRRSHTTRFHGIFGSAHRLRALIVPSPTSVEQRGDTHPPTAMTLARRLDWASLLRRVWGPEVTTCPSCGDTLRVLAFITRADAVTSILEHLGLATELPKLAPARASPAPELDLTFP